MESVERPLRSRVRRFGALWLVQTLPFLEEGPVTGAPALLGAGMMGDRASVIFAAPDEISGFIKHDC